MSTIELAVRRLAMVSPPGSAAHAAAEIRRLSGFKPRANPAADSAPAQPRRLPTPTWADPRQTQSVPALRTAFVVSLAALAGAGLVLVALALLGRPLAQGGAPTPAVTHATAPDAAASGPAQSAIAALPAAPIQRVAAAMPGPGVSAVEEPASAAQALVVADSRQAGEAITAWARAWSARDVPRYLGFYANEFTPGRGMSRGLWQNQRRKRLLSPASISVAIRDLRLEPLGADRMIARFTQDYAADTYRESGTLKMLVLVREPAGWRIALEALEAAGARAG